MAAKKKSAKKAVKKTVKKVLKKASKKPVLKATKPPTQPSKSQVQIGKPVGDFILPCTGGKEIQLAHLKGKNIVLYFYPKDDTPGCALEGKAFTQLHSAFASKDTEVFGISRDSLESHEKFKKKYSYSIDLLSDVNEKLCRRFGVIQPKNMYGRTIIGVVRSTFVIDKKGILRHEWRKVSVDGHAEEVLDFVSGMAD